MSDSQEGQFPVFDSRAQNMIACFLFVILARKGGSLTIPAKIWNHIASRADVWVQVKIRTDRLGNVTAFLDRTAKRGPAPTLQVNEIAADETEDNDLRRVDEEDVTDDDTARS